MALDPVTLIVGAIISIGLAFAASALLKAKTPNPPFNDQATTLSERGSYLPWLLGRRRMGAIFCWAGDRSTRKEKVTSGGKGGVISPTPKETVYFESAWHAICIGPAFRLHRIYEDGAVIWEGPIDSVSHPSGSSIPFDRGSFEIYWGQINQPVNNYLGSAGRIVDETGTPVVSRWPQICYVVWHFKRLGTSPRWPLIDYDIEVRVSDTSYAAAGSPWIEASKTLTGSPLTIAAVTNGVPGTCKIQVAGKHDTEFTNGGSVEIAGNAAGVNGTYRVRGIVYTPAVFASGGFKGPSTLITPDFTEIYLDFTLSGATVSGTIQPYATSEDDGVNPAYAAATLLFGKTPNGLGRDPAEFDLTTLDDLAQVCADEAQSCSLVCQQGDTAEAMLGALMQDVGFLIAWDVARGKNVFRVIRQELPGAVTVLDPDLVLPPSLEIQTLHSEKASDKLIFTFSDRSQNFQDMTIQVDDDGQENLLGQQRIVKIQLPTIISFDVAGRVAERRAQEELTGGSAVTFKFDRGARFFVPGQAFVVPGYPSTYRVERMVISDSLSGEVEIRALIDIFGSKPSTYVPPGSGGTPSTAALPVLDLAYAVTEVPSHVSPGVEQVIVPRIRANSQIVGADIYFSRDGISYTHVEDDDSVYTGGTLDSQLDADTFQYIAQGPTFHALGPDISSVLDLSGDLASWGSGRQLCLIDGEIFYLQKVTALGGTQYRLDGLMRARFDTHRAIHAAGSVVFIFQNDVLEIADSLLSPGQPISVKPQPKTTISLPLSLIQALDVTLFGKGIAPMPIELLAAGDAAVSPFLPNNSWPTGGGALLKWAYRSTSQSRSGAGLQGYGKAAGVSAVQGQFQIKIKTTLDVVKATYTSSTPSLTYSQAQLLADFGGVEPSAFKAEVANINGGLVGDSQVITVTRI